MIVDLPAASEDVNVPEPIAPPVDFAQYDPTTGFFRTGGVAPNEKGLKQDGWPYIILDAPWDPEWQTKKRVKDPTADAIEIVDMEPPPYDPATKRLVGLPIPCTVLIDHLPRDYPTIVEVDDGEADLSDQDPGPTWVKVQTNVCFWEGIINL